LERVEIDIVIKQFCSGSGYQLLYRLVCFIYTTLNICTLAFTFK